MSQDRRGVTIRGKHIFHSVAARDWFCSCGHKVVTRYFEESPHWRSVCSDDADHDVDQFVHTRAIPYVQFRIASEELEAEEVFGNLPPELQVAINERREHGD